MEREMANLFASVLAESEHVKDILSLLMHQVELQGKCLHAAGFILTDGLFNSMALGQIWTGMKKDRKYLGSNENCYCQLSSSSGFQSNKWIFS